MPLFDSAAENLIANAMHKYNHERNLQIQVRLDCSNPEAPKLDVTDDGDAISQNMAEFLMRRPVKSETGGQGMGLYQLARLANVAGYELCLTHNRRGCVRFTLLMRSPPSTLMG
jgi:sensor histidine kinase regulating citrate/malate metabolism